MSARKLRRYFEAHTIKVLTNQELNDIFNNRDISERISKWAMELSKHIDFEKRIIINSQILANFIAEWMEPGSATEGVVLESPWLVYCDEAWGTVGARAVAILISQSGIKLCYATRLQFNNEANKCTNNIAEYKAILRGASQIKSYWDLEMHPPHRLQSGCWANQKSVHCQATHPRKIPSPL
jgi:hypothetical protein